MLKNYEVNSTLYPLDPEADTTVLAKLGDDDKILVEDEVSVTVAIARTTLGFDR